jgi:MYXO-CTERM domain-containing protein
MKISNVSKLIGAGVIAASVAVVPFTPPASAQTDTGTGTDTTTTTTAPSAQVDNTADDNDTDWGWLGLLGLGGLAGLLGRKRHEEVHYRSADQVGSTAYRR